MEVKQLSLNNIGRFEELVIPLATPESHQSNVTVFVGNNGSGKTSILKALSTSLSWLIARIKSENGRGNALPELAILNGKKSASVAVEVLATQKPFSILDLIDAEFGPLYWTTASTLKGYKATHTSSLSDVAVLANYYRDKLEKDDMCSLPLIAFYSVERVVIDIPLKIRQKHSFLQLDGYDNALGQGVDFRRFFEWFREREDAENEAGLSESALAELEAKFDQHSEALQKLKELNASTRDSQLSAVREAIYRFMPGFSKLQVKRDPRLHMSVEKHGQKLDVAQLSQGEKSLMALVGDIARRMAMMNPGLEKPLHGSGVVMIDEVEMHLHPKWQRSLITRLTDTFPNCQFVLTTHSPLVISDCKNVLTYLIEEEGLRPLNELYGEDVNTVLSEVMGTDIRNPDVEVALGDLFDAIHDGQLDAAKQKLEELEAQVPQSNVELSKARLLMRKQALKQSRKDA